MDTESRSAESGGWGIVPRRPIERLTTPLERFLHVEAASGVVLAACTLAALALANSPAAGAWRELWETPIRISIGGSGLGYPLWYWINDGLMTLFFFVIGLEIKRELTIGELRDRRRVVLPIAGAVGGALLPVLIFLVLPHGPEGRAAWAVPMATDIAFVVGCLSILGSRVPRGLKVFLLSLAIVDDILAVIVIAAFYAGGLDLGALAAALAGFGVIAILNRTGVRTVTAYVLVGAAIWLFTLKSGIHPTVAGVALGLLTPASAWIGNRSLLEVLARSARTIEHSLTAESVPADDRRAAVGVIRFAAREAASPLERLEQALHPWVGFAIMPLFALANAGVPFGADTLATPLAATIAAALMLGKPAGVLLGAWVVVRSGLGAMPEGTGWRVLLAGGCLAGIGFTMSLFVASLGLGGDPLQHAKAGVLLGSALSLALGMALLHAALPKRRLPSGAPEGR